MTEPRDLPPEQWHPPGRILGWQVRFGSWGPVTPVDPIEGQFFASEFLDRCTTDVGRRYVTRSFNGRWRVKPSRDFLPFGVCSWDVAFASVCTPLPNNRDEPLDLTVLVQSLTMPIVLNVQGVRPSEPIGSVCSEDSCVLARARFKANTDVWLLGVEHEHVMCWRFPNNDPSDRLPPPTRRHG